MKKILVIKDELQTGGTTTSFLAFLQAMENQKEYEVYAWINRGEQADKILPKSIQIYKNQKLEVAFQRPKSAIKKIVDLVKYRQVMPYLKSKYLLKCDAKSSQLIACYQKMDIRKARKQNKITIKDFDAILTWEELYPCYLLSESIQAKRKIAWIHPDYIQCGFNPEYDKPIFEYLDAIVAVSEKGRQSLIETMPELARKFWCIENCVNVTEVREKSKEPQNDMLKEEGKVNLVTVARLQNISKALDRAVRIALKLKKAGYNFKWFFVGNGEDYDRMQTLIAENDVKDCMALLGHKDNPYPYMANADLFVLQSYYEGKPMVVDEAMIVGTPVLVSNYAAAKEQVIEGCGWVVDNNEDAIYKALTEILCNADSLLQYKENLTVLNCERYVDSISYIRMLDEVLSV